MSIRLIVLPLAESEPNSADPLRGVKLVPHFDRTLTGVHRQQRHHRAGRHRSRLSQGAALDAIGEIIGTVRQLCTTRSLCGGAIHPTRVRWMAGADCITSSRSPWPGLRHPRCDRWSGRTHCHFKYVIKPCGQRPNCLRGELLPHGRLYSDYGPVRVRGVR
jgi:hypothetical protein